MAGRQTIRLAMERGAAASVTYVLCGIGRLAALVCVSFNRITGPLETVL
jgi:hypothetical protein